ncbi:MAG: type IVB secretion system protein IcmQ, partial [Pseudomonadota bacterium]|nr:type IVB secretion system protein IcmQ [Pseudomonadota bacterium]
EKKIKDMREEAAELANKIAEEATIKIPGAVKTNTTQALTETVFISIYQHDPNNLTKWEKTLKTITEYSVTRPIYREEDHVQEMIRSRPDPNKEAYVAIGVKTVDIIKGLAGKAQADKAGHELVAIRDGCVLARNIKKFVHAGKVFEFTDGALKLIQNKTSPPEGL